VELCAESSRIVGWGNAPRTVPAVGRMHLPGGVTAAAIRFPRRLPRTAIAVAVLAATALLTASQPAAAATVTASYEHGRSDVVINGYGTRAMGSFRLLDGDRALLAWCLEADVSHSTQTEAYRPVPPSVRSAELDALLWWLDRQDAIDADTAVGAAALVWFYAGAHRSNGPLVWSDGSQSFASITPTSPVPWDALPPFSLADPVGLVVPGSHLDGAERRTFELHQLANALAGPWALSVEAADDRTSATIELRAPVGPLAGQDVEVAIEAPDAPPTVRHVTTGTDGRAQISLPTLPDGAVIRATVAAPGPHQEWDGDGSVQRLATSTSRPVRADLALAPLPAHVEVRKRSTDPTIGVAGATFVLTDRDGDEVGTATSDPDGVARFAPIDPVHHRPPYRVRERTAPPGLLVTAETVDIATPSHDPARPAIVEITNQPITVPLGLRKRLSIDGVGPDDLSGFSFEARRRSDGARHGVVTGPDGVAPPVALAWGTYDVCEVDVPDWAVDLIDTGCRTVTVDATSPDGGAIVVEYVNEIPGPLIETRFVDPSDDDQIVVAGAVEVVDRVRLTGLVPGVRYTIHGQVVRPDGASEPVIAAKQVEFVATAPTATIDVVFEIDGLSAGTVVATQRVTVGEVVLADHRDLGDPDQTVVVVPPTTTVSTTTTAPPASSPPASTPTSTTTSPTTPTSTSTSTSTSTTTTTRPPATSTSLPAPVPPPTLPRTGAGAATARLLRLGDAGFLLGIALVALAGLLPRRPGRDGAGC
jgi:hypothetical protein